MARGGRWEKRDTALYLTPFHNWAQAMVPGSSILREQPAVTADSVRYAGISQGIPVSGGVDGDNRLFQPTLSFVGDCRAGEIGANLDDRVWIAGIQFYNGPA